jgi:hypothetical protein
LSSPLGGKYPLVSLAIVEYPFVSLWELPLCLSVVFIMGGTIFIPSEIQLEQFLAVWSTYTYKPMTDKDEILLPHSLAYTYTRK